MHVHTGAVDARALGLEEARALVGELSAALAAREVQLERKQQEVAGMQDVQQRLMARPGPQPEANSRRKHVCKQKGVAGMQDMQQRLWRNGTTSSRKLRTLDADLAPAAKWASQLCSIQLP